MADVTQDPFLLAMTEGRRLIDQALAAIESGGASEAALADLRAHLVALLAILARDPGIDAASDDLYQAARALSGEPDPHDRIRRQRMVKEAAARLDERLARGIPRTAPTPGL